MAFRQVLFRTRRCISTNWRQFSSTYKFLEVSVNEDTGISTVTMNRPPVNSLNREMLMEISDVLTDLKKKKSSGMILTSFSNKIFTAGVDLVEINKPDLENFKQFWCALQDVWMQIYGSPFPIAAVINGHSPAGGCVIALACEYRVMVNKFSIGLSETQLGLFAPIWAMKMMINTIGVRNAELALTTGKMFKTDEAFKIGLIDEIAMDKEDALNKAATFFDRFEMIPPIARKYTKDSLRSSYIEDLRTNREKDSETVFSHVAHPEVQQSLKLYVSRLKNRKKIAA